MATTFTPVIVFDPGGSTGFASLDAHSEVLFTAVLSLDELVGFLKFINYLLNAFEGFECAPADIDVVVEQGPEFGHHSPVTRRAEGHILDMFPDAHRIPPTNWKSHPTSQRSTDIPRRLVTVHEHDAVRLGRWFQEIGATREEVKSVTAGQDRPRTRRKRK